MQRISSIFSRIHRESMRLYRSYPAFITVIIGGLATCCILGIAILQEKEIKENYVPPVIPVPRIVEVPSPNKDPRPTYGYVNTIVIHILEETSPQDFHNRTRRRRSRFAVHYSIAPDGSLYAHVPESHRAWHTPYGQLPNNIKQVNAFSLSIGLIQSPTQAIVENVYQLRTLRALLHQTVNRYVIKYIGTASQVSRDVRTDYYDVEFPFEKFSEYKQFFIHPLPGTNTGESSHERK